LLKRGREEEAPPPLATTRGAGRKEKGSPIENGRKEGGREREKEGLRGRRWP